MMCVLIIYHTLIERIAKTYLRIDFNFEDPIMAELSTQKEDTTLLSTTKPTGNVIIFSVSRIIFMCFIKYIMSISVLRMILSIKSTCRKSV